MAKWKAPVLYTAIGAIIGSTAFAATPAFASQNFKTFVASLVQDGQTVSKPSAIAYNGTSYFGIWWLEQQLKKDGVQVSWDGKSFSLTNMPEQQAGTLTASGTDSSNFTAPMFTNTINVNGVTYVPLSSVQALLSQMGTNVELKTDHDNEDSQGGLNGVVNKLRVVNEKLSDFEKDGQHAKADDSDEAFAKFNGALMQLQSAINQLQQFSTMSASQSSQTTTNASGSGTPTTNTSTDSSASGTASTSNGAQSQSTDASSKLANVISSLQNDWKTLNGFAVQSLSSSSASSSNTNLSAVISDINTQIQQLSTLTGQQHNDSSSSDEESSHNN